MCVCESYFEKYNESRCDLKMYSSSDGCLLKHTAECVCGVRGWSQICVLIVISDDVSTDMIVRAEDDASDLFVLVAACKLALLMQVRFRSSFCLSDLYVRRDE